MTQERGWRMALPAWELLFYQASNNKCPAAEFIASLPAHDQTRLRSKLQIVKQHGPQYDEFSRDVTKDIFDLRFPLGTGAVRLFCFYQPNNTIMVTHGVLKKSQRARRGDIELATQYMNDHLARGKQP